MGKINPWLAQKLAIDPPQLSLLLELEPSALPEVQRALQFIPGAMAGGSTFNFLRVTAPDFLVEPLSRLPGVTLVHYDAPIKALNHVIWHDPLLGDIELSKVLVPRSIQIGPRGLFEILMPFRPVDLDPASVFGTATIREWLELPDDDPVANTKVAIVDSGLTQPHPMFPPWEFPILTIPVVPSGPADLMGHGMWTTSALAGSSWRGQYGDSRGVVRIPHQNLLHIKALDDFGAGSTFDLMRAMEIAQGWGAKVISLSLSGPLQAGVYDDPVVKVVRRLADDGVTVVAAAGNSGPNPYTIESPGAAPDAISVGAYGLRSRTVSTFSSRGPQDVWYQSRPDLFRQDEQRLAAEGKAVSDLHKPDLLAPGGNFGEDEEFLYSGVTGWLDGENDGRIDGSEPLAGSSMATPIVAGMVAKAIDMGLFDSGAQLKRGLARIRGEKSIEQGFGVVRWPDLVRASAILGGS